MHTSILESGLNDSSSTEVCESLTSKQLAPTFCASPCPQRWVKARGRAGGAYPWHTPACRLGAVLPWEAFLSLRPQAPVPLAVPCPIPDRQGPFPGLVFLGGCLILTLSFLGPAWNVLTAHSLVCPTDRVLDITIS